MVGRFGKAVIAAAGLCLIASSVPAQPVTDPNTAEQKCEAAVGKVLAKFVSAKGKCVQKCISAARKAGGPFTGCFPPYSDTATQTCISDSLKGAETKAGAGIAKACTPDCPECYTNAQCTNNTSANPWVQTTEGDIDAPFGPGTGFPDLIYCVEKQTATAPPAATAKCEDGVSKALAKFVGGKSKCYAKCLSTGYKTGSGRAYCQPPNPLDAAANACIHDPVKGAEAKAKAAILKVCTDATKPSCYSGNADTAASSWVSAVETKVDQRNPQVACGSPSAAFLQ